MPLHLPWSVSSHPVFFVWIMCICPLKTRFGCSLLQQAFPTSESLMHQPRGLPWAPFVLNLRPTYFRCSTCLLQRETGSPLRPGGGIFLFSSSAVQWLQHWVRYNCTLPVLGNSPHVESSHHVPMIIMCTHFSHVS